MAAGKPVVSTCCGGPEEIVKDGESGYLVPVDSIDMFSGRVVELLLSEQMRKDFGRSGQSIVVNRFSVEHYASSIQEVILASHKK